MAAEAAALPAYQPGIVPVPIRRDLAVSAARQMCRDPVTFCAWLEREGFRLVD